MLGITRLIEEGRQEDVQLDFKAKADRSHGKFNDDDKRVFGKALSAFANSSGGLIIWGVDARKGPDQIDCAQGALPIANIELFRSEASRLTGELLMPRHEGVFINAIPSSSGDGSGFLLVRVERSERRPHRNEAKGDKQYYKRAGDNSFAMEHYDVEDAFRRISRPVLELEIIFSASALDEQGYTIDGRLDFNICNTSLVTAKMPYLQIRGEAGASVNRNSGGGVRVEEQDGWATFMGDGSFVIHPGMFRTIAFANVQYRHFRYHSAAIPADSQWRFEAQFRFGSEDLPTKVRNAEICFKDLRAGKRIRLI